MRFTLAALLAVSTVVSVPAAAEEKQDVTEANMPLSEFIEQNPEVVEQGGQGVGLEDYLDEGNEPVVVQPHPDSGNEVEFSAGSKEGVTQATISLGDYLEQHPEALEANPSGISLEEFLTQAYATYDENGLLQVLDSTGTWEQLASGDWRFLLSDGTYASGWHQISGVWYYFQPASRLMLTGWQFIDGYWYYFNPSGSMKHGWLSSTRNGETIYYYMGRPGEPDTGAMYTDGWLHDIDDDWYYLYTNSDASQHGSDWGWEPGVMHVGWLEIDGEEYYLRSDGAMSVGTVEMSDYVTTVFATSGEVVNDIMVVKDASIHGYPFNVRWDNLEIADGYRFASATINGSELDAVFPGITQDTANYYNNNSDNTVYLTYSTSSNADIQLQYIDRDIWESNQVFASTFCQNADGEWVDGDSPDSEAEPSYTTGTISNVVIEFYADNVNTNADPNPILGDNWIYYLVRHEVGHAVGLRHTFEGQAETVTKALMHPWVNSSNACITFQNYDLNELHSTYPG